MTFVFSNPLGIFANHSHVVQKGTNRSDTKPQSLNIWIEVRRGSQKILVQTPGCKEEKFPIYLKTPRDDNQK